MNGAPKMVLWVGHPPLGGTTRPEDFGLVDALHPTRAFASAGE